MNFGSRLENRKEGTKNSTIKPKRNCKERLRNRPPSARPTTFNLFHRLSFNLRLAKPLIRLSQGAMRAPTPDWPRPPHRAGFFVEQRKFHIFGGSNPVIASGCGALRRAPEYLSISTFAPASELHSLRGGFFVAGRQFPHFRATKSGLTCEVRCSRRAPRPAHARARSTTPVGRVFVAPAQYL